MGCDLEQLEIDAHQRPSFEQLAEAAQRLLVKRGLTEEAIYCSAPSYLVASLRLTLPFDNRKKIEAVLPFEIDDRLPIDVDDIIYDYLITDSAENSSQLLVSYVRKADLSQFLNALNEVGIDPKGNQLRSPSALTHYQRP